MIAALDVELCDCFMDYGEASAEMFLLLTFVAFGASIIWSGFQVADAPTLVFAVVALAMRTSVLLPVLRFAGLEPRDRRIIAWSGPRGLSALLLALLPVFAGIAGSVQLFQITCLVVLFSVVLHGGGIALFLRSAARAGGAAPAPTGRAPAGRADPLSGRRAERASGGAVLRRARGGPRAHHHPGVSRALIRRGEPVTLLDVRTERSYRDDPEIAEGAIRMPPDDAVRLARERGLDHHGSVVLYCT